jgi:RNA polymerase sigma factor (sigma-70 family)
VSVSAVGVRSPFMTSLVQDARLYEDPATLERLKRRDARVQEQVRRLQVETLTSTVAAILGSPDESEVLVTDLLTDFFFRYVDQLRDSRAIPSYLQIMAVRRARRLKERWQREVAVESNALTDDPRDRLDSELDDHTRLPGLNRCLQGLTDRARSLLRLHYGHELSYAAIGEQLGVSKQAVGKTIQKCLEVLRRCLGKRAAVVPAENERVAP